MTPAETLVRIRALEDVTNYAFCDLLDIKQANFSRYLKGDKTQISLTKQEELSNVLDDCEYLKRFYDPLPISFRNATKIRAALEFLEKHRKQHNNVAEMVSGRDIVREQFSSLSLLDESAPASAVA